jgi:hypothetical protein
MSGSSAKLNALTKEINNQWHDTKNYWKDAKSAEFEKQYIDELLSSVDKAITVMESLDKMVSKIRHDCE